MNIKDVRRELGEIGYNDARHFLNLTAEFSEEQDKNVLDIIVDVINREKDIIGTITVASYEGEDVTHGLNEMSEIINRLKRAFPQIAVKYVLNEMASTKELLKESAKK